MITKYRIDDDDDWQGAPTRLETTRCNNNEDRVENEDIYPSSLWKIYRAFYTIFYIQGRKTRTRFPKVIKKQGKRRLRAPWEQGWSRRMIVQMRANLAVDNNLLLFYLYTCCYYHFYIYIKKWWNLCNYLFHLTMKTCFLFPYSFLNTSFSFLFSFFFILPFFRPPLHPISLSFFHQLPFSSLSLSLVLWLCPSLNCVKCFFCT